jgi:phospholipid/cholesterol/gamma-HCH transport system substrate-binding protein
VVKVQTCGVCHTDLHYREGGINNEFPCLLGHEAAGVVEAVGPDVTVVAPGDFVVLNWRVGLGDVAITYQPNLEQLLVFLPPAIEMLQGSGVANRDSKQRLQRHLSEFNLNLNLPPPCSTGFLPAQQQRAASEVDYPSRPAGDIYCRVPQDSMFNVRGARNLPCETRPGKRAPTVKMCESDENYVPLNDGFSWKGDPNATLSGQSIPQPPPGTPGSTALPPSAPPPLPIATAEYDPNTGTYIGTDGLPYVQADLAPGASEQKRGRACCCHPQEIDFRAKGRAEISPQSAALVLTMIQVR